MVVTEGFEEGDKRSDTQGGKEHREGGIAGCWVDRVTKKATMPQSFWSTAIKLGLGVGLDVVRSRDGIW